LQPPASHRGWALALLPGGPGGGILAEALVRSEPLERYFRQAVLNKPQQHDLVVAEPAGAQRGMSQIGGRKKWAKMEICKRCALAYLHFAFSTECSRKQSGLLPGGESGVIIKRRDHRYEIKAQEDPGRGQRPAGPVCPALPVRFLTFRFVILLTMALLIPLIILCRSHQAGAGGQQLSYVMSVAVSSIVLLYATISEARQKQIAELQEKRATEDHTHVTEMHALIMQTLENQNKEMDELKSVLASLAGKELVPLERAAMPGCQSLQPARAERFSETDPAQHFEESLHQNALVTTLRKRLTVPPMRIAWMTIHPPPHPG